MCALLYISRSYYYKLLKLKNTLDQVSTQDEIIAKRITYIWNNSKMIYGSRKIAAQLDKEGIKLSPYKVLKCMKELGISSMYSLKRKFKPYTNKKSISQGGDNLVQQQFDNREFREVLTSDLAYVKCGNTYGYVCFVVDLYNREIIAHGVSDKHDAQFVGETLDQINLAKTTIFHSDRGTEFVNTVIEQKLLENDVSQSLSKTSCPYDNAISENLFGIFKREWAKDKYETLDELKKDVDDFVHNYNNFRLHSKLKYQSPVEYRISA